METRWRATSKQKQDDNDDGLKPVLAVTSSSSQSSFNSQQQLPQSSNVDNDDDEEAGDIEGADNNDIYDYIKKRIEQVRNGNNQDGDGVYHHYSGMMPSTENGGGGLQRSRDDKMAASSSAAVGQSSHEKSSNDQDIPTHRRIVLHNGDYNDSNSNGRTSLNHLTMGHDPTLTLLLPLLILLSTLLFLLVFFLVFLIVLRRRKSRGIALLDHDGPLDLSREEEFEGEGGIAGVEERWLEQQDEFLQRGYERAKLWQQQYLPNSMPTDITLSQFLSIQEKGVSAWSFEPDYESNSAAIVTSRTEITFLQDGIGMTPQEGGACCVQSNLPLPRLNEVYYWECKFFEKPQETNVAIGLTTKPYPSFRMPGFNRYSIGYHSADGFKSHNYPFTAQSYGPSLSEGDVLGVGYRPRTGAVFFTRNGKKLEDAYIGLTKHNLFPTVAADGSATIHVNLGQAGFVFIEANVKKWGLAPMIGTLAPPPAYGSEGGSILLETAATGLQGPQASYNHHYQQQLQSQNSYFTPSQTQTQQQSHLATPAPLPSVVAPPPPRHQRQPSNEALAVAALQQPPDQSEHSSSSSRSSRHRRGVSNSTAPIRPSPLRTSITRQRTSSYTTTASSSNASSPVSIPNTASVSPPNESAEDNHHQIANEGQDDESDEEHLPHNPPTPGQLDISLRALSPFSRRAELEEREEEEQRQQQQQDSQGEPLRTPSRRRQGSRQQQQQDLPPSPTSSTPPYQLSTQTIPTRLPGDVSPPSYHLIDANQYPAGVAEAMLEAMPEEHFNALFSAAAAAAASNNNNNINNSTRNANSHHFQTAAPTFPRQHNQHNGGFANPTSGFSVGNGPNVGGDQTHGTSSSNSSVFLRQYENRDAHADVENQYGNGANAQNNMGLGLRGFFGSIWGGASRDNAEQT